MPTKQTGRFTATGSDGKIYTVHESVQYVEGPESEQLDKIHYYKTSNGAPVEHIQGNEYRIANSDIVLNRKDDSP